MSGPERNLPESPANLAEGLEAIEQWCVQDPGGRGIGRLMRSGDLEGAARSLLRAEQVLIVSGFYILAADAGETDGPPGALALGWALMELGIQVQYATDEPNLPCFQSLGAAPLHTYRPDLIQHLRPSHLVAIERAGRAADGRYYNMRGEDMTAHTAPMDQWFLDAPTNGITTVAIGDGGNEIGMGGVADQTRAGVPNGGKIASVVPADFLIASGVSNWGAYGLVAGLSRLAGTDLLPDGDTVREQVRRLVSAGAVDGVTLQATETVDGLPIQDTIEFLAHLHRLSSPA